VLLKEKKIKSFQDEIVDLNGKLDWEQRSRANICRLYDKILDEGLKIEDAKRVVEKYFVREKEKETDK